VRVRSALTGGAWTDLIQWDENDNTGVDTITLDATAACAGAADCQFEWRYEGAYDWYWGVDNVLVDGFGCSTATCNDCPALSCTVSVDPATVCQETQIFMATPIDGTAPYTYKWDFSYDGVTFNTMATYQSPIYTYPASGSYTVAAWVTDSCTDGAQETICAVVTTVSVSGAPTVATVSPDFGTTLGGTEVTVTGENLFDFSSTSVVLTNELFPTDTFTVPATGSLSGTQLTFVTPSLVTEERTYSPGTYSVEVITECCTPGDNCPVVPTGFEYVNIGVSAQEGASPGSLEIIDVDNNVLLTDDPVQVGAPADVAITRASPEAIGRYVFSLEDVDGAHPILVRRTLGNPGKLTTELSDDAKFDFGAQAVEELPNELAVDPVDAGLVYVTSITKLPDPTQIDPRPAGVRVLDVSGGTIVSDPSSPRIADDLIELHNCLDDGTGHCVNYPSKSVRWTFATDIEVIAVNATEFGVPYQVGDSVTVVGGLPEDCTGTFTKADVEEAGLLVQRYGYATNSTSNVGGELEGNSRISILDLNPCFVADIDSDGNITLASNYPPGGTYQMEVAVFGPAAGRPPVPPIPGPAENLGLTLARNDEGAFIYAINKRVPPEESPAVLKIDAVSRDFAYGKKNFDPNNPEQGTFVNNAQDVVVIERDLDGEATKVAALDGVNGQIYSIIVDIVDPNVGIAVPQGLALGAADDMAVNGGFLYVSLGTGFIAEIAISDFTKTRELSDASGSAFQGTLKGIAFDNAGKLYVCEDFEDGAGDDRVARFTIPLSGTQLQQAMGDETTDVVDPVDVTVDEVDGVVAVLDLNLFPDEPDKPWQLKLFNLSLMPILDPDSEQVVLNSLKDPRDVVTEEPGVYVVAERATNGAQTGEIRLFTQTIAGTSKKIIRGQFGATGVDILGDHTHPYPASTCIGGVCPGKRYVVSDVDVAIPTKSSVFKLEKPVTLITGTSPNDAVTVGSGLDQQVWVCSGEPGLFIADGTTNIINVFQTVDDTEIVQTVPPYTAEVPINIAAPPPVGEAAFAPTSMAVAEFEDPLKPDKVFVTMFDSDVILVYDADPDLPNQYQLSTLPPYFGIIPVGAGPRRIVIQPEIVEP
jgi:hypothetical protein